MTHVMLGLSLALRWHLWVFIYNNHGGTVFSFEGPLWVLAIMSV